MRGLMKKLVLPWSKMNIKQVFASRCGHPDTIFFLNKNDAYIGLRLRSIFGRPAYY